MVTVNMIMSSGLSDIIARIFGKPIKYIFGISEDCACAVILGSLGGFPIGAVCTRELYDSGKIEKYTAERLITFTNNASPAFCIGTLGLTLFSDVGYGIRLYFCQLAAAFLLAIAQRQSISHQRTTLTNQTVQPISDILTSSVTKSGTDMLKICSFAVFFAVAGDALCIVAARFFGDYAAALSASLAELTLAGRRCAIIQTSTSRLLCAFAVGWSGFSVHMQCASVLSDSDIGMRRYYVCKLFQGILCSLFVLISFSVT